MQPRARQRHPWVDIATVAAIAVTGGADTEVVLPARIAAEEALPSAEAAQPAARAAAEEAAAINRYTKWSYDLNKALYSGEGLTPELAKFSEELSAQLAKLPNYVGKVGRGLNSSEMPAGFLAKYVPGQVVTEAGYVSADIVKSFPGDIQMTIFSTAGKAIKQFSHYAGTETEVLIDKGARFLVQAVDKGADGVTRIVLQQVA